MLFQVNFISIEMTLAHPDNPGERVSSKDRFLLNPLIIKKYLSQSSGELPPCYFKAVEILNKFRELLGDEDYKGPNPYFVMHAYMQQVDKKLPTFPEADAFLRIYINKIITTNEYVQALANYARSGSSSGSGVSSSSSETPETRQRAFLPPLIDFALYE
jgi:hypothetical protein